MCDKTEHIRKESPIFFGLFFVSQAESSYIKTVDDKDLNGLSSRE